MVEDNPACQQPTYRPLLSTACLVALTIVLSGTAAAIAALPVQLRPIATDLPMPTTIAHAGDGSGRLFITLQGGRILIHDGTHVLPTPFLDISTIVSCCGERGLLGLAFHPKYASNGMFYLNYTNTAGDVVIARYAVSTDPDRAQVSSMILLTIPKPFANHNGGQLAFGPDGYLYIGVGDGGGAGDVANNAQNLGTFLGKILRIDVDGPAPYRIPPTNPFVGVSGARAEIWAYGVRNPWRFSFDRLTGDLFISDVGQSMWEEVNFQPAGGPGGENYGWRRMEGMHCFNPSEGCNDGSFTLPIIEYPHGIVGANPPDCSIAGGYRYRGTSVPELAGHYVFADTCSGRILAASPSGTTWTVTLLLDTPYFISSFGEDELGELYVAQHSETGGAIHRVVRTVPRSSELHDLNGDRNGDLVVRHSSGLMSIWLMSGTTITGSSSPVSPGTDWTIQAIADFDGTGRAGILWRNASGELLLWLMNGTSVFSVVSFGIVGRGWSIVNVGDFDGDGKADILWRHTSGELFMWLMNGTTISLATSLGSVGTGWTIANVADFDGDGKADILWRHTSGTLFMWLMNGTSLATMAALGTVTPDWTIADVGDFDADGKVDILWRHTSGLAYLWFMNGTTMREVSFLGDVSTDWTIQAVHDFNGDVTADILWRHASGFLYIWLMSGTAIASAASPGNLSVEWSIR